MSYLTTHSTHFIYGYMASVEHWLKREIAQWAKDGTCAHDRRALQQLALNVHVKHTDLTCKS